MRQRLLYAAIALCKVIKNQSMVFHVKQILFLSGPAPRAAPAAPDPRLWPEWLPSPCISSLQRALRMAGIERRGRNQRPGFGVFASAGSARRSSAVTSAAQSPGQTELARHCTHYFDLAGWKSRPSRPVVPFRHAQLRANFELFVRIVSQTRAVIHSAIPMPPQMHNQRSQSSAAYSA